MFVSNFFPVFLSSRVFVLTPGSPFRASCASSPASPFLCFSDVHLWIYVDLSCRCGQSCMLESVTRNYLPLNNLGGMLTSGKSPPVYSKLHLHTHSMYSQPTALLNEVQIALTKTILPFFRNTVREVFKNGCHFD